MFRKDILCSDSVGDYQDEKISHIEKATNFEGFHEHREQVGTRSVGPTHYVLSEELRSL